MTRDKYKKAWRKTIEILENAGIAVTEDEKEKIEVVWWGLEERNDLGIQILTYVNTDRVCAKELVLFPRQTCIQHLHPTINGQVGKEETFRCRKGEVYILVEGPATVNPKSFVPEGYEQYFSCALEIVLKPGDQYTLYPDSWHWFQAGPDGAILSEFSSYSHDEDDLFTDPRVVRFPEMEG